MLTYSSPGLQWSSQSQPVCLLQASHHWNNSTVYPWSSHQCSRITEVGMSLPLRSFCRCALDPNILITRLSFFWFEIHGSVLNLQRLAKYSNLSIWSTEVYKYYSQSIWLLAFNNNGGSKFSSVIHQRFLSTPYLCKKRDYEEAELYFMNIFLIVGYLCKVSTQMFSYLLLSC